MSGFIATALLALLTAFGCSAAKPGNAGGSGGASGVGISGQPGLAATGGTGGAVVVPGSGGQPGSGGTAAAASHAGAGGIGSSGAGGQIGASGTAGLDGRGASGAGGSGTSGTGAAGAGGSGAAGAAGAAASGFNPCPTTGDACKVLPFGDSITFGVGSDAQGGGGYRVDLFSRAVMAGQKLTFVGTQANGPSMVAGMPFPQHHAGYSGYTIAQITAANLFDGEVATKPHIVLLHIGTNDMYRSDAAGAPQRLATLLDDLVTALPNALIVVAKIIPMTSATTQVDSFNTAIAPLVQQRIDAGKHVVLVDQHTGFQSTDLGSDGIHPNVMGYQKMAGVWYAAISASLP